MRDQNFDWNGRGLSSENIWIRFLSACLFSFVAELGVGLVPTQIQNHTRQNTGERVNRQFSKLLVFLKDFLLLSLKLSLEAHHISSTLK